MTTRVAFSAARVAANAMTKAMDAGRVVIHASSQPSDVAASAHGTVLVSANLAAIAFVSARDGAPGAIVSANGISAATAITSGAAGWFRAYTSAGVAWVDGSVGQTGSDMNIDNTSIDQGQIVTFNSWTITLPEA